MKLGIFAKTFPGSTPDAVLAATHHGSSGAMVAARTAASPSVQG